MDSQVALGFYITARLLPLSLAVQKTRQQRAEGLGGSGLGKLFLGYGVAPKMHLSQQSLRGRARLAGIERAEEAEYDAAGASGDGVLDHPRVHAAGAHPQAETGQALV